MSVGGASQARCSKVGDGSNNPKGTVIYELRQLSGPYIEVLMQLLDKHLHCGCKADFGVTYVQSYFTVRTKIEEKKIRDAHRRNAWSDAHQPAHLSVATGHFSKESKDQEGLELKNSNIVG